MKEVARGSLFLPGILLLYRGRLSVGLTPLYMLIDGILKSDLCVFKRFSLKRDKVISVHDLPKKETMDFIKLKNANVSFVVDHDSHVLFPRR
jgi:hypothetical protein